ncbi:MAG: septum formation protein Maf [Oligoflexia bacterium]|nr:septum formation protein Maf [Oligoflexia bacterium]
MLKKQGYVFKIIVPRITESTMPGLNAAGTALKNSNSKAKAIAAANRNIVILSADTVVCKDNVLLGKPADKHEAMDMLMKLNNSKHTVITAYSIVIAGENDIAIIEEKTVESAVVFGNFERSAYSAYIKTGEPFDKAGAYAIQETGGRFIREVHGSYSNIVGLPLMEVMQGLKKAGVAYPWE